MDDGLCRPEPDRNGMDCTGGPRSGSLAGWPGSGQRCGPRNSGRPSGTGSVAQEDAVSTIVIWFSDHPPSSLVKLLRTAAGSRWAIATWEKLAKELKDEGTWYGEYRHHAIMMQGKSSSIDHLCIDVKAFTTWATAWRATPTRSKKTSTRFSIGGDTERAPGKKTSRSGPAIRPSVVHGCRPWWTGTAAITGPRGHPPPGAHTRNRNGRRGSGHGPGLGQPRTRGNSSVTSGFTSSRISRRQWRLQKVRGQTAAAQGPAETAQAEHRREDLNPWHRARLGQCPTTRRGARTPQPRPPDGHWCQDHNFGNGDGRTGRSVPNAGA